MISNTVSPSLQCRFLTVALIAALGIGGSLTALGQAGNPVAGPQGTLVGGMHVFGADALKEASKSSATDAAPAVGKGENAEKGAGGVHQGLKFHGHWAITVKNPDGTQASHQEFENSVAQGGEVAILAFVSGQGTPSDMMIGFYNTAGTAPCVSSQSECGIVRSLADEPADSLCQVYYCVTGLTSNFNYNASPPTLTYAGSFTATQAGAINTVATYIGACGLFTGNVSSVAPNVCNTSSGGSNSEGPFSGTTLSSPVSVLNGQIIQITVVFTIS